MTITENLKAEAQQLETKVQQKMRQVEETVQHQVKETTERLQGAGARVTTFIREKPGIALGGAFLLGYLIARMARS